VARTAAVGSGAHDLQRVAVHGHQRAYVRQGSGPPLLLLHGIGSDHRTWDRVIGPLAEQFTVIAPDLLGHGASDRPRGDYSIGGYANGMRDLLALLDVESVTVVGHSLGGGVAMQMAYQYPMLVERLVLVGPGGLGLGVHPLLRALTLPGAGFAVTAAELPGVRQAIALATLAAHRAGLPGSVDAPFMLEVFQSLGDAQTRNAFLRVLRGAVDWRGQQVTMRDRGYLVGALPVCVVWGERDSVVPCHQVEAVQQHFPATRVVKLAGVGHFPHVTRPEEFVTTVREFMASTAPARHDPVAWRRRLCSGEPDPQAAAQLGSVRVS
jgi:pimeloyl-ACP methyl ester carboxylesterase